MPLTGPEKPVYSALESLYFGCRSGPRLGGVSSSKPFYSFKQEVNGHLVYKIWLIFSLSVGITHSWVSTVLDSMGQARLSDTIYRFPLLGRTYMKLDPQWLKHLADKSIKHEELHDETYRTVSIFYLAASSFTLVFPRPINETIGVYSFTTFCEAALPHSLSR